jgi:hypothetical protein
MVQALFPAEMKQSVEHRQSIYLRGFAAVRKTGLVQGYP